MSSVEILLQRLIETNEEILRCLENIQSAADDVRHSVDVTNPGSGPARILESLERSALLLEDLRRPGR